jgi:hypothetical protein
LFFCWGGGGGGSTREKTRRSQLLRKPRENWASRVSLTHSHTRSTSHTKTQPNESETHELE